MKPKRAPQPIAIKIIWIVSGALLLATASAASFVAGYGLAFSKVQDVYVDTELLKAKADELEERILHLRNYAVLIDVIALNGKGVTMLGDIISQPIPPVSNSVLDTVYIDSTGEE